MSPEILLGNEFDLPTDIFSLGVIFAEISARKLADDRYFKRTAPSFQIDSDEIHSLASPGCPPGFIQLAIDCLMEDPQARPGTREILERLRIIEAEILALPNEGEDLHTGSIKFITGSKRPGTAPRIPSFGQGVGKNIRSTLASDDESDDELVQAVMGLENVTVNDGPFFIY
jgi:LIM domain kinase 1